MRTHVLHPDESPIEKRKRINAYWQDYNSKPENRILKIIRAAQSRARKKGLEFDLALFEFAPLEECECCGIELDYSTGNGHSRFSLSPTLDRVDNGKGYTEENSRIICYRCNMLKADMDLWELEKLVEYVRRHSSQQ